MSIKKGTRLHHKCGKCGEDILPDHWFGRGQYGRPYDHVDCKHPTVHPPDDTGPTKRPPDRMEAEAKLSERKTVHNWLNDAGIPREEFGNPICLLRRLRIAIDHLPQTGDR